LTIIRLKMKIIYPFLFLIVLLSLSCTRTNKTQANENLIDSLALNSKRITNTLGETLIPAAKKELSLWKEYHDVDEFIITYYNISISEALNNSKELESLVRFMKDSIRVDALKKTNVKARFNVLHNETLRLVDMASIPSISDEEVDQEVTQILEIYSAVNAKINTVYKAKELQNALEIDTETPIGPEQVELKKATKKTIGGKIKPVQ